MFIDRLFFALLVIFLPTQLTRHFFFDFSLVKGLRIDYYSLQISLTDIFFFLTIFFWFFRKKKKLIFVKGIKKNFFIFMVGFLIPNFLVSTSKELFLIKLSKIIELCFLAFYIINEKIPFKQTINYLLVGGFYSSILAFLQFINQSSVGGFWWFLGERTFSIFTPGIAKAEIFGRLYLRPYATFPHPNVLGSFLALSLSLIIFAKKIKKPFNFILFTLFKSALLLSFSRVAILVGFFGVITASLLAKKQTKYLLIAFLLTLTVFGWLIVGRFSNLFLGREETLVKRSALIQDSLKMFLPNPVFGVGLNNFIKVLPDSILLQPVHNTYLLVLTETGIIGFGFFMFLLYKIYKKVTKKISILTILFFQLIIMLFFDHYFYTLQQGQLLFTILLSFMIKEEKIYV